MKPLSISALAAVAGLIALTLLFPRYDPSAHAPLALDRANAVDRVRQLASRYGVETAGWRATVTDQTDGKVKMYRAEYPDDPAAKLFDPLRMTVTLLDPGGRRNVHVVMFADGRLSEWKWNPPDGPRTGPSPETVLADFVGSSPGSLAPDGATEEGASRYAWNWQAADRFPLRATLKIEQKAGVLLSATLAPAYNAHFDDHFKHTREPVFGAVAWWVGNVVWMAGLGAFLWQSVRFRMRWTIPLVLLGAQILWAAVSFWGGTYYQEFISRTQAIPDKLLFIAGENSTIVWSFFWLPVFAGAGFVIRSAGNREKWHALAEICRGRVLERAVAGSVAAGMLTGIGLAALPYLVALLPWPDRSLDFRSVDALVAPSAGIAALRLSAAVPLLALFGFLFPLLRQLRRSAWFWTLFLPVGILALMDFMPFRAPAPSVTGAALLLGAYLLLYLRCDLLAVVAAAVTARAAIVPALLLSQPLSASRSSALGILTLGAAAIATSVYWSLRGPEPEAQPEVLASLSPDAGAPVKSDRERLQAEFGVARKAQRDALPGDPPLVNGYSLAGWCEPAQQVGGDLYDFFPLPDGRMGIAVADVSGKGVPAALYMMVTKGLLTAVSRESNQLAYILEQINLHLYRACRKKVFVTMAAVVLDPENRRLEYGRAGHNPVVWRRTRRGETTLVKPPGLGLGMTPGERFTRTLRIDQLDLEPEDALVLYSDGVTEAIDAGMDQFGESRLMRAVEKTDGQSAADSRDSILHELRAFMGTVPPRDDITLVVIRA